MEEQQDVVSPVRALSEFKGKRVLVVGDAMLDRTIRGRNVGASPESGVPKIAYDEVDERPGGAANVAKGLAALDCHVCLSSILGNDEAGGRLLDLLRNERRPVGHRNRANGATRTITRTITKTRIFVDGEPFCRIDDDADHAGRAWGPLYGWNDGYDAVVISDYGKGGVSDDEARFLVRGCRGRGIPCIVDTKRADASCYAGATVLTPNRAEAERMLGATGVHHLHYIGSSIRWATKVKAVLVTDGEDGMYLSNPERDVATFKATHIPSDAKDVVDVTGAGDTVVCVLAAALAAGWPIEDAARLSSIGAAVAVSKEGTHAVTLDELQAERDRICGRPENSSKVLGLGDAVDRVRAWRSLGQKVVFTNGCFDVLHVGHLATLKFARAQGDVLVVGLNSDESVWDLKGKGRPIVPQHERAEMLAALECVDMVVIFDGEHPGELVEAITPDVLVKGSEYSGRYVAGAAHVNSKGGKVVLAPTVPNRSTSRIAEALGLS